MQFTPALLPAALLPGARLPSRFWGCLRRCRRWLTALVVVYCLFLLAGFIPAPVGYNPPPASNYVTIFVRSNDIHTDIVVPVRDETAGVDWRNLFPPSDTQDPDAGRAEYVAIGWGDRGFFINTQLWSDMTLPTVAHAALWPSETVLHVDYLHYAQPSQWMHELRITHQQHRDLIRYIESFIVQRNAHGAAIPASDRTYGTSDRFYRSAGAYHLFSTCNQWTGAGLRTARQPTGIWTPTKTHVLYWLPQPR